MSDGRHPDRAALERRQLARLRAMVEKLLGGNGFYGPRLRQAGVSPRLDSLADYFAAMPFTTKEEIVEDQLEHPPHGTNLTYPLERYTRFSQTSGTTGTPMRWLDTAESWSWMVDNWVTVLRESGVRRNDWVFCAFSFGPFLGFWTAFEAAVRHGCMAVPGGGLSSASRLRVIIDNGVTVMCCTPTYAIRLAEVAAAEGIDLGESRVRLIIAAGEPGASIPATRQRIESAWPRALLKDHHGMTEIGPVSFECPQRAGVLHVMEHAFIPEVIDPVSGAAVSAGRRGELVLTNLGRLGSPLLRYRTGDLVQPAAQQPCECGRFDMALEGGILGRTDDMVVVRGVNIFPSAVESIVRTVPGVAEYRVRVTERRGMTELQMELESAPAVENAEALARQVSERLRHALNIRVAVTPVAAGTLPRFELKARRWVRAEGD